MQVRLQAAAGSELCGCVRSDNDPGMMRDVLCKIIDVETGFLLTKLAVMTY